MAARHIAMDGYPNWDAPSTVSFKGRVQEILSQNEISGGQELLLNVKVLSGPDKGFASYGSSNNCL